MLWPGECVSRAEREVGECDMCEGMGGDTRAGEGVKTL